MTLHIAAVEQRYLHHIQFQVVWMYLVLYFCDIIKLLVAANCLGCKLANKNRQTYAIDIITYTKIRFTSPYHRPWVCYMLLVFAIKTLLADHRGALSFILRCNAPCWHLVVLWFNISWMKIRHVKFWRFQLCLRIRNA